MKTRNIGGSILPSSEERILRPIPIKCGTLQVVPLHKEDTHALMFGSVVLASHPNGYSCHNLAERIKSGNSQRALEQAEYILRCGGMVHNLDAITSLANAQL